MNIRRVVPPASVSATGNRCGFVGEASTIGLPPGEWPEELVLDVTIPKTSVEPESPIGDVVFYRERIVPGMRDADLGAVVYVCRGGGLSLTVYND